MPVIPAHHGPWKQKGRKPLDIERFRTRLYRLCDQPHGGIIVGKRNSWYAFKENVLRGYVRLVAERNGVALGADQIKRPKAAKKETE